MKLTITELPYLKDTSSLLHQLNEFEGLCALESAAANHENGQWSIITAAPVKTVHASNFTDEICSHIENLRQEIPHNNSTLPFTGGVIGHAGYSAKNKNTGPDNLIYSLYSWAFLIDHNHKKGFLAFWSGFKSIPRQQLLDAYLSKDKKTERFRLLRPFEPAWSKSTYKLKIEQVHELILSGDVYQINLTQKFHSKFSGSSLEAYNKLKKQSNSPYLSYFRTSKGSFASASPEQFIECKGQNISSKPIKGTIQRSKTTEGDQLNITQLKNSKKDQAENLMITDLLRNDLSINCCNVKVPKLFQVESFETVHHLVTTITATMPKEISILKVFKDAFPGGSITGAPKKRSMEVIDELEDFSRSFYCGSTFYYSSNDAFSSNILIRSFEFEGEEVTCWAGGGITIDSTWQGEYQESLDKISRLMQALED